MARFEARTRDSSSASLVVTVGEKHQSKSNSVAMASQDDNERWQAQSTITKTLSASWMKPPNETFQLEAKQKITKVEPKRSRQQAKLFVKVDPSKSSNEPEQCSGRVHISARRSLCLIATVAAGVLLCLASLSTILNLVGSAECHQPSNDNGLGNSKQAHNLLQPHSVSRQRAHPVRMAPERQLLLPPTSQRGANGRLMKRDKQIIQTNPSSFVLNGQQQQASPDAPKLIPLSALDRYQEGADLRLFCSASAPKSAGRLHFEWRKNQNEPLLADAAGVDSERGDEDETRTAGSGVGGRRARISIMDESASLLRITQLEADDSGNYTCLVRNQHGFDSSTVRVNVMVKLKWIVEPPSELRVRAGKFIQLECDASGQPAPLISWTNLKDHQTINSKVLRIDRVSTNDSGLYECRASNGMGAAAQQRRDQNPGEQLRKIVRLIVNDSPLSNARDDGPSRWPQPSAQDERFHVTKWSPRSQWK